MVVTPEDPCLKFVAEATCAGKDIGVAVKPMIIRKLPIIMQLLMKVQKKEVLLEDALSNGMDIISPDGASTVVTELTLPALELVLFLIKDNYLIPCEMVSDSHPYFVYIVSP